MAQRDHAHAAFLTSVAECFELEAREEGTKLALRGDVHSLGGDATYAEACQEILDEIYPEELTALNDTGGSPNKSQINSWFQHQGFGGSNATQMASTYVMIAEKRLPEPNGAEPKKKTVKVVAKAKPKKTAASLTPESVDDTISEPVELPLPSGMPTRSGPNIHLDIQIHIPATATPDQIDQIFASMAKHLYQ